MGWKNAGDTNKVAGKEDVPPPDEAPRYTIVDVEVGVKDRKIHDIGALRHDGATFHKASKKELFDFLRGTDYICGHNIIHHDPDTCLPTPPTAVRWWTPSTCRPCCFPNVLTTG